MELRHVPAGFRDLFSIAIHPLSVGFKSCANPLQLAEKEGTVVSESLLFHICRDFNIIVIVQGLDVARDGLCLASNFVDQ